MPDDFVRETREIMLRRTRVVIFLGAFVHVAFVAVDAFRVPPERYREAVALRLIGAALLLCVYPATRGRNAVRWAEWLGSIAFAIVTATTASIMPLFESATDSNYAIQGTGIVLCILGAGLLLPFDGPKMLALGLLGTAIHVGFTLDFPLAQNFAVVVVTLTSVLIATVGARELTRSRLADFEGRRAKEELLRVRADFVAMLTHDIKNPLGVIDGFVEMLREEPAMPAEERDALLGHAQRAVRTAIALAVNVLDASKIDAGGFVLRTCSTNVGELIGRAVANHRPYAAHKGIALVDDSAPVLPAIRADPAALDRVLGNLLSNAIKHTPSGGTVCIAARAAERDRVEIVVEDSGEGLQPGQEAHIFERYTGAASRADSTGLGLFISRTITSAHGGTISAENRTDGRGARFRVVLPGAESAEERSTDG
jgi:signal transduction histidine kinase